MQSNLSLNLNLISKQTKQIVIHSSLTCTIFRRKQRWERIIQQAVKQSLTPTIPLLHSPISFETLINSHINSYDSVSSLLSLVSFSLFKVPDSIDDRCMCAYSTDCVGLCTLSKHKNSFITWTSKATTRTSFDWSWRFYFQHILTSVVHLSCSYSFIFYSTHSFVFML